MCWIFKRSSCFNNPTMISTQIQVRQAQDPVLDSPVTCPHKHDAFPQSQTAELISQSGSWRPAVLFSNAHKTHLRALWQLLTEATLSKRQLTPCSLGSRTASAPGRARCANRCAGTSARKDEKQELRQRGQADCFFSNNDSLTCVKCDLSQSRWLCAV